MNRRSFTQFSLSACAAAMLPSGLKAAESSTDPLMNKTFTLTNARVARCLLPQGIFPASTFDAEGLALLDLQISDGKISHLSPAGSAPVSGPVHDQRGGQIWPCPIDLHTHLDKGHIWPRAPLGDGTVMGAVKVSEIDLHKNWSQSEIRKRFEFSLRCALAHGTKAIRTHLNFRGTETEFPTWELFAEIREAWKGRIDLQASAFLRNGWDTKQGKNLAKRISQIGGQMGTGIDFTRKPAELIDGMFRTAMDSGLNLDLHVDETLEPGVLTLETIAETALKYKFSGKILCGHCCSLSVQPEATLKRVLDKVAAAGISIVSLPIVNLWLQDRGAVHTPRLRGVTVLHELRARGIPVAVASDNTRDPFHAYGDMDLVEIMREATRIAHLEFPYEGWLSCVTTTPAQVTGWKSEISLGQPADLILFNGRGFTELFSRPQSDRIVLRKGKRLDATVPDYRELDDILKG
jgi:cytosine deaminase